MLGPNHRGRDVIMFENMTTNHGMMMTSSGRLLNKKSLLVMHIWGMISPEGFESLVYLEENVTYI